MFVTGTFVGLVVDRTGTPFVATGVQALGGRATVLRYTGATGSGWEPVGEQGMSYGACYWSHLAVDANNVLYFAYQDRDVGMGVSRWIRRPWCKQ